jgi:protein-S-isoprenylcysteine O-methyltransferase Ste14
MSGNSGRRAVPPPVYFSGAFTLGYALHLAAPLWLPPAQWLSLTGWLLMGGGGALAYSAIRVFNRAGTTIRPDRCPAVLVTSGPYRYTRNPMYVALVLLYTGASLASFLFWPLMLLPFAIWMVQVRVVRSEEAHLRRRFGPSYSRYAERVRCWL